MRNSRRYYGIDGVSGKDFRRVALPKDSPRGGVLTMAACCLHLHAHAHVTGDSRQMDPRANPWHAATSAPPDVPPLGEQKQVNQTASLRQRLETHRARTECAGCHNRMDRSASPWRISTPAEPARPGRKVSDRSFGQADKRHDLFGARE